jgi:hypothetical protein
MVRGRRSKKKLTPSIDRKENQPQKGSRREADFPEGISAMNDVKDYRTRRTAVGERQRPSMCEISDVLARA